MQTVLNIISLKRFNYCTIRHPRHIFTLPLTHISNVSPVNTWDQILNGRVSFCDYINTMPVFLHFWATDSEKPEMPKSMKQLHWGIVCFYFFSKLILMPLFLLPVPANKHFQQQSERLAQPECLSVGTIKSWCQTKSLTKVFFSPPSIVMSNVLLCANVPYFFVKKDKTIREREEVRKSNRDYRLNTLNMMGYALSFGNQFIDSYRQYYIKNILSQVR